MHLFRRNTCNRGSPQRRRLTQLAVVLSAFFLAAPAHAATYYIAPNGSDGGAGSSASPWKTFAHAIPLLNPGDTLLLKDGTYTKGSTGVLNINCTGGAKNASLASPITVKAENERQAFILSDGLSDTVYINKCTGWVIEGLHVENVDNASNLENVKGSAQPIAVISSNDIIIRRNLARHPNRYGNNSGILVYAPRPSTSRNVLLEENELYDFHRNGIECFPETTSGCVIRRNFVANRNYGPLSGVRVFGPNDGIVTYFAVNSIVENNIIEMNGNIAITNPGSNNRFYGNIGIGGGVGMGSNRHPHYGMNNTGTLWVDNVSVGAQNLGMTAISVNETQFLNNTVIASDSGFHADNKYDKRYFSECPPDCWSINPGVRMANDLAVYKNGAGYSLTQTESYTGITLDHLNSFGNGTDYAAGTAGRTNSMSVDPGLGSCKVFIPDGSPMKGAGANGDDIGANVLCRYQNGVLQTNQLLWDRNTGAFPCGAIVHGINDIAGESCFDVHKRLNVNTNGCNLPANPICKQPTIPANFPPISALPGGGGGVFYSPDGKVCPSGYSSR